jgi:hypothetical protein
MDISIYGKGYRYMYRFRYRRTNQRFAFDVTLLFIFFCIVSHNGLPAGTVGIHRLSPVSDSRKNLSQTKRLMESIAL